MSMGMSYEEYWYGDTTLSRYYYQAYQLRLQQRDYDAWLAGAYVKAAIESSIGNAFRKSSSDAVSYPSQPYTIEEKRQREINEEQEALIMQAWMTQFVEAGKNWGTQDERM